MADGQWYYCLLHHEVEPYDGCKAENRLGPYASADEAAKALDKVRERNEAWEAQDAEGED